MAKEQIKSLNSLRGIWAVLIFLNHFLPVYGVEYHLRLGEVGVLFFFILSGFILCINNIGKTQQQPNWSKGFIVRRLSKIFPIQWLMTAVYILTMNVSSWLAVPFHITLTQSFSPFWTINQALNGASWFLSSLLFCYLVFPFIINSLHKSKRQSQIFYIILLGAFSIMVILLPDSVGRKWLCYINPFARALDFGFGVLLGLVYLKFKDRLANSKTWLLTVAEIAAVALTVFSVCYTKTNAHWPMVWLYPIIGSLVFVFAINNGLISKALSIDPLTNFLGEISLCIYMTHGIIYKYMMNWFHFNWVLEAIIILCAVVAISWLLQKYFIPWSSRLFIKGANKLFPPKTAKC